MKSIISHVLNMLSSSIDLYHEKKEQLSASLKKSGEITDIFIKWSHILGNMLSDKTHRKNLLALSSIIIKAKLKAKSKIAHKTLKQILDRAANCAIAVISDKKLLHSIAKNKAGIASLIQRLLDSSPESLEELGINTEMSHKDIIKNLTDFSQSFLKLIEDNPDEFKIIIQHLQENIDLKEKDIKLMPSLLGLAPEITKIASDPSFNETLSKLIKLFPRSSLACNLTPIMLWSWGENYLANIIKAYINWNTKML